MITLGQLSDFTPGEFGQLQGAAQAVNRALLDTTFIATLLAATYTDTLLSSSQVIQRLMAPLVISRLYCENLGWWATHISKTIASEDSDTGIITFNRAFFDNQDIPSLANTLFHEAAHVAGFAHLKPTDSLSVPYQAGNLLETYLRASS